MDVSSSSYDYNNIGLYIFKKRKNVFMKTHLKHLYSLAGCIACTYSNINTSKLIAFNNLNFTTI